MKKFIAIVLLIFINPINIFAESKFWDYDLSSNCSYSWEFNECLQANLSGTTRTIEDFVCLPSTNYFDIMSQIILDKKFKEIDEDIDKYITDLEEYKDYYFGNDAQKPFTDAIDEIENVFWLQWEFWYKYMDLCDPSKDGSIVSESLACFNWNIPMESASGFFDKRASNTCQDLVKTKLDLNKRVSYDVLKLNKVQIKKDYDKSHMQKQRNKYDELIDEFRINLTYLERMWRKWPSKTKTAKARRTL